MHEKLGALIRERRTSADVSLRDLQTQSGIAKSVLSKLENGQGSCTLETLDKVAKALGLKLSELFKKLEE